jgi:hypothetical protein
MQKAIELLEKRKKHWDSIEKELNKQIEEGSDKTIEEYFSYYDKEEHESIVKVLKTIKRIELYRKQLRK